MHSKMGSWVRQVNDASGFLKRLYVRLKDTRQRDCAESVGIFAREWARNDKQQPSLAPRPWIGLESTQAERRAWTCAIQGLLGLNILVALADANNEGQGKPGSLHARLNHELDSAVRGFATAFPREIVETDLDSLCPQVIDEAVSVAEVVWHDIRGDHEADIILKDVLKNDWLMTLRPALMRRLDNA